MPTLFLSKLISVEEEHPFPDGDLAINKAGQRLSMLDVFFVKFPASLMSATSLPPFEKV